METEAEGLVVLVKGCNLLSELYSVHGERLEVPAGGETLDLICGKWPPTSLGNWRANGDCRGRKNAEGSGEEPG